MTTSAVGRVVDENDVGLEGLGVVLEDISQQFDVQLAADVTESHGVFSLKYADHLHVPDEPGKQLRRLRLRIRLGQHVLHEIVQDDLPAQDQLTFPSIKLTQDEANSWWATLRTAAPSRRTQGNAIRWLADNEDAWDRVAQVIDTASRPGAKLDVMQLTIDAAKFQADKPNDPGVRHVDQPGDHCRN